MFDSEGSGFITAKGIFVFYIAFLETIKSLNYQSTNIVFYSNIEKLAKNNEKLDFKKYCSLMTTFSG